MERDQVTARLVHVLKERLLPSENTRNDLSYAEKIHLINVLVQGWEEKKRLIRMQAAIKKAYVKKFNLTKEDFYCLEILFSPLNIPGGLTEDELIESLNIYDFIYMGTKTATEAKLGELYQFIVARKDMGMEGNLSRCLESLYRAKYQLIKKQREHPGSEFIELLPLAEQEEFYSNVMQFLEH